MSPTELFIIGQYLYGVLIKNPTHINMNLGFTKLSLSMSAIIQLFLPSYLNEHFITKNDNLIINQQISKLKEIKLKLHNALNKHTNKVDVFLEKKKSLLVRCNNLINKFTDIKKSKKISGMKLDLLKHQISNIENDFKDFHQEIKQTRTAVRTADTLKKRQDRRCSKSGNTPKRVSITKQGENYHVETIGANSKEKNHLPSNSGIIENIHMLWHRFSKSNSQPPKKILKSPTL